jgi:hypothetical protein
MCVHVLYSSSIMLFKDRSRWLRGLRRRSAAARLQGLRVRNPPGHGYLSVVSVVCCQVVASAPG